MQDRVARNKQCLDHRTQESLRSGFTITRQAVLVPNVLRDAAATLFAPETRRAVEDGRGESTQNFSSKVRSFGSRVATRTCQRLGQELTRAFMSRGAVAGQNCWEPRQTLGSSTIKRQDAAACFVGLIRRDLQQSLTEKSGVTQGFHERPNHGHRSIGSRGRGGSR
jgi:hypothetical protein